MDLVVHDIDFLWTGETLLEKSSISVEDGEIVAIAGGDTTPAARETVIEAARIVDGRGKALLPGFKNGHTHAAMTLLRGYGDDMALQEWLQTRIWPVEAALTPEDIYWGTRLAALEMIRTGTTFANDMYFYPRDAVRAFEDAGIKAAVGLALFDFFDEERRAQETSRMEGILRDVGASHGRGAPVSLTVAPHSIYTCGPELLRWSVAAADEAGLVLHTHLAETRTEVENARRDLGMSPFSYAHSVGLLSENAIAAHAVWLEPEEIAMAASSGVTVVYNPASNMKLASGAFPFRAFADRGVPMMLAPDGVASNNNLDMFDEMKLASLLQKHHNVDPELMTARETLDVAIGAAMRRGERSHRTDLFPAVGSAIVPGAPADFVLLDLSHPQMVPVHNLISNVVYAGGGGVVDTVVCGGRVLMEDGEVPGSEEVITEARRCASALVQRVATH